MQASTIEYRHDFIKPHDKYDLSSPSGPATQAIPSNLRDPQFGAASSVSPLFPAPHRGSGGAHRRARARGVDVDGVVCDGVGDSRQPVGGAGGCVVWSGVSRYTAAEN